jgi:hypothetical protein
LKKLKKLAESLFTNTKGWLLCQKSSTMTANLLK